MSPVARSFKLDVIQQNPDKIVISSNRKSGVLSYG